MTTTCKVGDGEETVVQQVALPLFGGTQGQDGVEAAGSVVVSQDVPMKIEGSDSDGVDGTFRRSFRRGR